MAPVSTQRVPLWGIASIFAVLVASAPPLASAGSPPAPNAALYQRTCSICHGTRADGRGVRAAQLEPAPADLTRLSLRYGPILPRSALVARVLDARRTGHTRICGERVFAKLSFGPSLEPMKRGTVLAVLAYLETLQRLE